MNQENNRSMIQSKKNNNKRTSQNLNCEKHKKKPETKNQTTPNHNRRNNTKGTFDCGKDCEKTHPHTQIHTHTAYSPAAWTEGGRKCCWEEPWAACLNISITTSEITGGKLKYHHHKN
ncbi:hypothetical protein AMECASPLE_030469 [Ameca splendens]|uniref:Uncharacterized protein n=1 Tax=Ameca splendens TaxID=208324 RepID=A0ABV1A1T4_9TELE